MSRLLVSSLGAVCALGLALGCSSEEADKPAPSRDDTPDAGEGDAPPSAAYLLMHTVDSPEGRENYVYITPSLEVGELDRSGGREFSGPSRSFVLDGKVYVADAETLSIQRFDINDDLKMVESGQLSFANHGLSYFDTGWTFIDEDHAYYMNGEQQEVIVWSPKTMEITGTIDLSSLKNDEFGTFYADGGTLVGDYLFAMFWNYDEEEGLIDPAVNVAVISTKTHELVSVARDERCAMAWVGSVLPNGDFYIPGNAASTGYQYTARPEPKANCLLRIRSGETDFDPDFVKTMDEMTDPLVGGATFTYAKELDGAVVWGVEPGELSDRDDYFATAVWRPRVLNTETWTSVAVDDRVSATGWMGDTLVVDGAAHFTIGTNGGTTGDRAQGALVRYQDGELTELVEFSDWLQVVQRIR